MADRNGRGRDLVAIILAAGFALAINMLMAAVLYDALRSDTPGLSENATQVVIAGFAAISGLLGAYLGARAVERAHDGMTPTNDTPDDESGP